MDRIDKDFPMFLLFRRLGKLEKSINAIVSALSPAEDEMPLDDEENTLKRALRDRLGDNTPSHNQNAPSGGGFSIVPID